MRDHYSPANAHYGSQYVDDYALPQRGITFAHFRAFALLLWCFVFSGGFVMIEPSLYELLGMGLIITALIAGYTPNPRHTILSVSFIMLIIAGVVTYVMDPTLGTNWLRYHFITFFLLATTIIVARMCHDRPHLVEKIIFPALLFSGTLTSILGIAGYFGAGGELFTLFGRAKGAFKDPNVFAPYLILPVCYCIAYWIRHSMLHNPHWYILVSILAAGVFFSFSRGGWGVLIFSSLLTALMVLRANASNTSAGIRFMLLAIASFFAIAIAVVAVISTESVFNMLTLRVETQRYDVGEGGRFDRIKYMFPLIFSEPWGIGHVRFGLTYGEDPHNSFLKMFIAFGWLGGIAHLLMVLATLIVGIYGAIRRTPWQIASIALFATFLGITLESLIIDVDHWRIYYLIMAMIWGLATASRSSVYHEYRPI